MTHPSDDTLVGLATGEPVDQETAGHVDTCDRCRRELEELRGVEALLRARPADLDWGVPDGLWARITEATTTTVSTTRATNDPPGSVRASPASPASPAGPVSPVGPLSPVSPAGPVTPAGPAGPVGEPVVSSLPSPPPAAGARGIPTGGDDLARVRARRRRWLPYAAAAACLAVGVGLGRWVLPTEEPSGPGVDVLAIAELRTLDGASVVGSARLERLAGSTALSVTTRQFARGPGYVEVWLINTDLTRMISVGVLDAGADATFRVPADAIAQGYRIVDLSREAYDNAPQHSGDSIMRGTLPA